MDSMDSRVKFSFLGHFTWNPCRIHRESMESAWTPPGSMGEGKVLNKRGTVLKGMKWQLCNVWSFKASLVISFSANEEKE